MSFNNILSSYVRNTVLMKKIEGKLDQVNEKKDKNGDAYGVYLFSARKSRIIALAFENTYRCVKDLLKVGVVFSFPPGTFSCKPRKKKYNSNSTSKYDLTFRQSSKFLDSNRSEHSGSTTVPKTSVDDNGSTIQHVNEVLRAGKLFNRKLISIKFRGGEVYRYVGCKTCYLSIPRKHTDNKYYCTGICNKKQERKHKNGVVTERKICFTIHNVEILDDRNETINSVVIYNAVCESLFKKSGSEFYSDNDAVKAWNDLIINNSYDISIRKDKKKQGSTYPAAVFVEMIDKVTQSTDSTNQTETESVLQFTNDNNDNVFVGNKKQERKPDFPKYEMKLLPALQQRKNQTMKYLITSKPPGLVLLINNNHFPYHKDEEHRVREGSQIDIDLLERGFTEMGFEIYKDRCILNVQTKKDFYHLLVNFKKELVNKNVDSSIIIISSHGNNFEVSLPGKSKDSICVIEEMLIPFSDDHFASFQGKPKIFIPITCQNLGSSNGRHASLDFLGNQLFDMMVCFPCLPGYAQRRYHKNGSLYVHYLMANLMKHATTLNFTQVLENVQEELKKQIQKHKIKITLPYWISSAFRQFYFVPQSSASADYNDQIME